MTPLYDAHFHLQFDSLGPHLGALDADLRGIGYRAGVVNGTNEDEWPVVAQLSRRFPWVVPSHGLHPWDCGNRTSAWQTRLRAAVTADDRAHVGEIGLDRWIVEGVRPGDPRLAGLRVAPLDEQAEVFAWQLALAAEFNRTASIHCTQAFGVLLEVLRTTALPARGFLLHGYGGPAEMVKTFADLGAYFSYNVEALQPRHAAQLASFKAVPADRLLVETDAPVKAPPPERNRFPLGSDADGSTINHPGNIAVAYDALAELRGVALPPLAAQVEENFRRLFLSDADSRPRREPLAPAPA
ncbi:MAG: TatD family hydrolase [Opitutae bacterium]|nr:TatD family hydrolase [Opitutae bacterium]